MELKNNDFEDLSTITTNMKLFINKKKYIFYSQVNINEISAGCAVSLLPISLLKSLFYFQLLSLPSKFLSLYFLPS